MLSEPRRQQLDSIVRRMVDNKESDQNIQTVVGDFSQKYKDESLPQERPQQSLTQKLGGFVKDRIHNLGEQMGVDNGGFTRDSGGKLAYKDPVKAKESFDKTANFALGVLNPESGATTLAPVAKEVGSTAKFLMDKALGTPKNVIKAGRSPAAQMVKEGLVGTAEGIKNKTQEMASTLGPQVQEELSKSGVGHSVSELLSKVGKKFEGGFSTDEIKSMLEKAVPQVRELLAKDQLNTLELNKFRSLIDHTLGDKFFLTSTHPFTRDVVGGIANEARSTVQNTVESSKPLFKKWSAAIQANKSITDKIAASSAKKLPFILAGGAGLLGEVTGGHQKALEYATLEEAVRRGRESPLVLSALANLTDKVGRKIGQVGAANILTKLSAGFRSQEGQN